MNWDLAILAIVAPISLLACWLIHTHTKRNNLRHGWDAHKNGLNFNLAWGPHICDGWLMRANGDPRP